MDISLLFSPLDVRGHTLRNRLVMPPMVVNRGIATPEAATWYGARARGGVALVIVEATSVQLFGWELTADNLRPLVEAIHAGGALAAIQLFPTPRRVPRSPNTFGADDIQQMLAQYAIAARACAQAGFDGIEPHGAHGFLLNQFFAPQDNRRADAYGGSLENRMRLALEVVTAVKPACEEMLLLYRHTPVGRGYGLDDSRALAVELVRAGVDVLDLSPSSVDSPGDRSAPLMGLGASVIAVNDLEEPGRALFALRERRADLIAVGRQLIADAEWPNKLRAGREGEIVRCIKCDGCHKDLQTGIPVGCTQWGAL